MSFPASPSHGMIFESKPGEFYIYSSATSSWTRIDGHKFGLATHFQSGLMSSEDVRKLNSLIVPPPQSTITGEECNITFKGGTVEFYSSDKSVSIHPDLEIRNPQGPTVLEPWKISENTAGIDFRLNIDKLVAEIEERGRLTKVQYAGPDGLRGFPGEDGVDSLETGPEGSIGEDGANSPFAGSLATETIPLAPTEENSNRAIVSVENSSREDGEYLVVTRANIGDPDACPDRISPQDFDSPWLLVLDSKLGRVTRRVEKTDDCTLTCRVCVSNIYYLNIESIVQAVIDRYDVKLAELKYAKERLVRAWVRVMDSLFTEQKYALCCALENCETRKRNQSERRYIEQQKIFASANDRALVVDSGGPGSDRVQVHSEQRCEDDGDEQFAGDSRVRYGEECDEPLVTMQLSARVHNKDPRSGFNGRWLQARLPKGDYILEVVGCCSNFSKALPPPSPKPKRTPPPPPPPPQPQQIAYQPQAKTFVPPSGQSPTTQFMPSGLQSQRGDGQSGVQSSTTFQPMPPQPSAGLLTTQPAFPAPTFRSPTGAVPPGLRFPASVNTPGGRKTPEQLKCTDVQLKNMLCNQPGCALPGGGSAKGSHNPDGSPHQLFSGYISHNCNRIQGGAMFGKVPGCIPKVCDDPPVRPQSDRDKGGRWSGRVAILHNGFGPGPGTDSLTTPLEKVTELRDLGFFDTMLAARNVYMGHNTLFSHAGGLIKAWIPDPDRLSANNDGGVTIAIRSRKCVEELREETTDVTVSALPTIYVYRDHIDVENLVGSFKPFVAEGKTHVQNYGLSGGKANIEHGPDLDAEISKAFFVLAEDGLGMYHVHHNGDSGVTSDVMVDYLIEDNASGPVQAIVQDDDDTVEVIAVDRGDLVKGRWSIDNDTEGMVIGPLDEEPDDDWTITLDEMDFGSLKKFEFVGADGDGVVLAKGAQDESIPQQVEGVEPFVLCRVLRRSCNTPAGTPGRYSLGITNRVLGKNFRICRILPEWKLDGTSYIRKPVTYAPHGYPCGTALCDVKYRVKAGSDGEIIDLTLQPRGTGEPPFVDGNSVDILFLFNASTSLQDEIQKFSVRLDNLKTHLVNGSVENVRFAVATFGGAEAYSLELPFTSDAEATGAAMRALDLFDDATSPGLAAINTAASGAPWHTNAVKMIVLLTDQEDDETGGPPPMAQIKDTLRSAGVILNVVCDLTAGNITEQYGRPNDIDDPLKGITSGSARAGIGLAYESGGAMFRIQDMEFLNEALSDKDFGDVHTQPFHRFRFGLGGDGGVAPPFIFGDPLEGSALAEYPTDTIELLRAGLASRHNFIAGGIIDHSVGGGAVFKGALVHAKIQEVAGDKIIASAITDSAGRYVLKIPVDILPRRDVTVSIEVHLFALQGQGDWVIDNPFITPGTGHTQGIDVISDDSAFTDVTWVQGSPGDPIVDTVGSQGFIRIDGFHSDGRPRALLDQTKSKFADASQRVQNIRSETIDGDRKFAFDIAFDDRFAGGPDLNFGDLIVRTYNKGPSTCLPSNVMDDVVVVSSTSNALPNGGSEDVTRWSNGSVQTTITYPNGTSTSSVTGPIPGTVSTGALPIHPVAVFTTSAVIPDLSMTFVNFPGTGRETFDLGSGGFGAHRLNAANGGYVSHADHIVVSRDEGESIARLFQACGGGFWHRFREEKLREIRAQAAPFVGDCNEAFAGGKSLKFESISGAVMDEATLDGKVVSVTAQTQALPGTAIRAVLYDKMGRGFALREQVTAPEVVWETLLWQRDDIHHYINDYATTQDAKAELSRSAEFGDDPRIETPEGRIEILTSGLEIKLRDLQAVAFEFVNPDTGNIVYVNDIKVGVERAVALAQPETTTPGTGPGGVVPPNLRPPQVSGSSFHGNTSPTRVRSPFDEVQSTRSRGLNRPLTSTPGQGTPFTPRTVGQPVKLQGSSTDDFTKVTGNYKIIQPVGVRGNNVPTIASQSNVDDTQTFVVYVDIANFEPMGSSSSDPGEIPFAVFEPQKVVNNPGVPGESASATLILPDDGEQHLTHNTAIQIGKLGLIVFFVEEINGPNTTGTQVLIGQDDSETLANLKLLVNDQGTNGVEYHSPQLEAGLGSPFSSSFGDIRCTTRTSNTLRFEARTEGIEGNGYYAHIRIGLDGVSFGVGGIPGSSDTDLLSTMSGGIEPVEADLPTILEPTEEDFSAYLENWWTITGSQGLCERLKDYCDDCIATEVDGSNPDFCQRYEIDCIAKGRDMRVPLNKYIFTPQCPSAGCNMHWKRVEWYERGWRTSACCGAIITVDGQNWIIVKRSIGADPTCGGGESDNTPCIQQFVDAGLGHPAIAWPSGDGEEFLGRPTSGFQRMVTDEELSERILRGLTGHEATAYRGGLTPGNAADTIPFIIFPNGF